MIDFICQFLVAKKGEECVYTVVVVVVCVWVFPDMHAMFEGE